MEKKVYNFAVIGAGGYIAPRHMKAIKDTGNRLIAALDPNDSVGIIDSFFPEADFFLQPERFDRHLDKLRRQGENKVDFVSICSPNFLHDSHIRLALRNQANAICEKPIVLNPWNIDALEDIEKETGLRIYNILQLRLHPQIIALKEKIQNGPADKIYDLDLTYITSRGKWYHYSWKGDVEKSGGLATNIGVHFFDMLGFVFGKIRLVAVHHSSPTVVAGFLQYDKARVRWFLSIDPKYLPEEIAAKGQRTYRSILIDGKEFEFSEGFTDLHTRIYEDILAGGGYGLEDARQSVEIVYQIRNAKPFGRMGDFHPYLLKVD
ncbi:MAG: Oxidoreductase, Gfo/Idh/MocA family [Bacteroidetes bacterium 38_7]|nr:MAG: Oxidoreductase, Gfo/Idh/MocA family [Bacteroidetes bacterium 38_7]HAL64718.1 oxidoreductase [Bacteroidales bacterium]